MLYIIPMVITKKIYTKGNGKKMKMCHYKKSSKKDRRQWGGNKEPKSYKTQNINNKMAIVSSILSVIALHVNELNSPT